MKPLPFLRLSVMILLGGFLPAVHAQKLAPDRTVAAEAASSPIDREAQELVRDILSQQPEKPVRLDGEFTIRTEDGRRHKVPLKYAIVPEEDGWRGIYETQPTSWRGAERVEIIHRVGQPNEYLYSSSAAPEGKSKAPVELHGREAFTPFVGSDYWLADLGMEFFHWPEQRLLRDAKITMRWGNACHVLESVSPNAAETKYARVVSWLDIETGAPIRAEAYDGGRKRIKIFTLKGLTKSAGQWQPKELRMLDTRTDSETRLEFGFVTE